MRMETTSLLPWCPATEHLGQLLVAGAPKAGPLQGISWTDQMGRGEAAERGNSRGHWVGRAVLVRKPVSALYPPSWASRAPPPEAGVLCWGERGSELGPQPLLPLSSMPATSFPLADSRPLPPCSLVWPSHSLATLGSTEIWSPCALPWLLNLAALYFPGLFNLLH